MGRIAIVAYRPHAGKSAALRSLIARHVPLLRDRGLATDRAPVCMEASDGALVEVFEWISGAAIQSAHGDEVVQQLWSEFAPVCDDVPVGDLDECGNLFSEFAAVAESDGDAQASPSASG